MNARQIAYLVVILTAAAVVTPVMVVVGVVVLPLSLPFLLIVGLCVHAKYRRRMNEAARLARCSTCGERLGDDAVERAAAWSRRATREDRCARIRDVHAICGRCGAWYVFDFEREQFVSTTRPTAVHA